MKLFRITLQGMKTSYGISYVVSSDPTKAYEIVRKYLNKEGLGPTDQRELDKIELIAEDQRFPECHCKLYLEEKEDERTNNRSTKE